METYNKYNKAADKFFASHSRFMLLSRMCMKSNAVLQVLFLLLSSVHPINIGRERGINNITKYLAEYLTVLAHWSCAFFAVVVVAGDNDAWHSLLWLSFLQDNGQHSLENNYQYLADKSFPPPVTSYKRTIRKQKVCRRKKNIRFFTSH